jgi:hypothetical protein
VVLLFYKLGKARSTGILGKSQNPIAVSVSLRDGAGFVAGVRA